MKLGTDISIAECRRSGYVVMEYKHRELVKHGVLDKDAQAYFSVSLPEHWTDAGTPIIGFSCRDLYLAQGAASFNDLLEIFEYYGDDIKSFIDFENCPIEVDAPSVYDLLQLASAIDGYSGLYTWNFTDHERY